MRFTTVSALALFASYAVAAPISNIARDEPVEEVPDDECDASGIEEVQVPFGGPSTTTSSSAAASTSVIIPHASPSPIASPSPVASPSPSPSPVASPSSKASASSSASSSAAAAATGGASSGGSGRASATNPAPVDGNGNMVVQNNCAHPIFLIDVETSAGTTQTVESNGQWSQPFALTADGTGSVLKVWKEESQSNNITQIEYSFANDGQVWYDISLLNGDPFAGVYNAIIPPEESCQSVVCDGSEIPCSAAYLNPEDPKNYPCSSKQNLIWEVCASS